MITQDDAQVKQFFSQNPKIVSHSEVASRELYAKVPVEEKDAISEVMAQKDVALEEIPQQMEYRREIFSQKYVTLRDAHGYLVLQYDEDGQARPRRWVPHSEMTRAIEEANTGENILISKKPHLTHTTQKGELISVHL